MGFRTKVIDYSRGNNLDHFWHLYECQVQPKNEFARNIYTYFMSRSAQKHGGYVGPGATIKGIPCLPHGLHGIYISRYAVIGAECKIYQNVTIGEVDRQAPAIGDGCLIGAGAVIIGGIKIGNHVKIGAGAVVSSDVPDFCTVVSQPCRIIEGINYE